MSNQIDTQPNWHPNFRIESTLPDTRVIRTIFLLKTALYTALLFLAVFILEREYQAHLLRQSIDELKQQVQSASSADTSRLNKSKQFRTLAMNIKELQQFFRAPMIAHESVVELSAIKPEELVFTNLSFSESVVKVKGKKSSKPENKVIFKLDISGNVQDLTVLTKFKRELEESKLLNPSGYRVSIDESIEQRDAETGIIPFTLTVSLTTL